MSLRSLNLRASFHWNILSDFYALYTLLFHFIRILGISQDCLGRFYTCMYIIYREKYLVARRVALSLFSIRCELVAWVFDTRLKALDSPKATWSLREQRESKNWTADRCETRWLAVLTHTLSLSLYLSRPHASCSLLAHCSFARGQQIEIIFLLVVFFWYLLFLHAINAFVALLYLLFLS